MTDPDIAAVLNGLSTIKQGVRLAKVKRRQRTRTQERLATQIELLSEELEEVMPRSHPMFESMLLAAMLHKLQRLNAEPEFKSYLELPPGF